MTVFDCPNQKRATLRTRYRPNKRPESSHRAPQSTKAMTSDLAPFLLSEVDSKNRRQHNGMDPSRRSSAYRRSSIGGCTIREGTLQLDNVVAPPRRRVVRRQSLGDHHMEELRMKSLQSSRTRAPRRASLGHTAAASEYDVDTHERLSKHLRPKQRRTRSKSPSKPRRKRSQSKGKKNMENRSRNSSSSGSGRRVVRLSRKDVESRLRAPPKRSEAVQHRPSRRHSLSAASPATMRPNTLLQPQSEPFELSPDRRVTMTRMASSQHVSPRKSRKRLASKPAWDDSTSSFSTSLQSTATTVAATETSDADWLFTPIEEQFRQLAMERFR